MFWVIAMIQQDGDLGNVYRFCSEVVNIVRQHLNQSRIVGEIRASTVREEWKP